MSSRRDELQRQRDLVARHLAWLDAELAALPPAPAFSPPADAPSATTQPPAPPNPPPTVRSPLPSHPPLAASASWTELPPPNETPLSKTGCWVGFVVLLLLGAALTLGAIYHFYREPATTSLHITYQHICNR